MTDPQHTTDSADSSPLIVEHHCVMDSLDVPFLDRLSAETKLSKQVLKKAMAQGSVWLTRGKQVRRVRRKNVKLKLNDEIHLYYNEAVSNLEVTQPQLIADEKDYSVWDKPYGVWSQGSKWGDHCSMGRLAEAHFEFERASFVVHRLDRAANGIIIIAHNKNAAAKLSALFASRELKKVYRATVEGELKESVTVELPIDEKSATSHVSALSYDSAKQQTRVEVAIETGRKHQIRIHLASLGHPIVGDRLHGNATENTEEDLQLTAYKLEFVCPLSGESKAYSVDG